MTGWLLSSVDEAALGRLALEAKLHPVIAKILINRGIYSAEEASLFLNPRLKSLPDPFLLPDMEKGALRVIKAVLNNETIGIFGDYDTDGITSASVLISYLRLLGAKPVYHIPHRIDEGYGMSISGIDRLASLGATLIITTDNGINCFDEIEHAATKKIDVVVTDHHELTGGTPKALAVIDPKRPDSPRIFSELAGVGVAFYLAAAVNSILKKKKIPAAEKIDLKNFLDLVAVGTVADVAPLTGINRILVKNGLEVLKTTQNSGLKALAKAAGLDLAEVDTRSIAFRISPRLNAAGRIGDQNIGMELLTTGDEATAEKIAEELNSLNTKRQSIEKNIVAGLEIMIEENFKSSSSIVVWSKEWHPGVIGIVASKLSERHRKPSALISIENGMGRGSIRSVGEFNIINALQSCKDSLENFGGHASAAGFDISIDKLEQFKKEFEEYCSSRITENDKNDQVQIDAELGIKEITQELIAGFSLLEPFGEGNPEPVILLKDLAADSVKIVGSNHLKLKIKDGRFSMDAIGFGLGGENVKNGKFYSFAGIPQINEWNGTKSIQFKIKSVINT